MQISGRIWTVVGKGYFLHASSSRENVVSARGVTPLWFLIGRFIVLTREKTSFAIHIGRLMFFTRENHRSFLWLATLHLRIKIYDIAFESVFLLINIFSKTERSHHQVCFGSVNTTSNDPCERISKINSGVFYCILLRDGPSEKLFPSDWGWGKNRTREIIYYLGQIHRKSPELNSSRVLFYLGEKFSEGYTPDIGSQGFHASWIFWSVNSRRQDAQGSRCYFLRQFNVQGEERRRRRRLVPLKFLSQREVCSVLSSWPPMSVYWLATLVFHFSLAIPLG